MHVPVSAMVCSRMLSTCLLALQLVHMHVQIKCGGLDGGSTGVLLGVSLLALPVLFKGVCVCVCVGGLAGGGQRSFISAWVVLSGAGVCNWARAVLTVVKDCLCCHRCEGNASSSGMWPMACLSCCCAHHCPMFCLCLFAKGWPMSWAC